MRDVSSAARPAREETHDDRNHIPPMVGKTVLITGANSGIGLWAARGLGALGAQIVMVCRKLLAISAE